MTNVNVDVTPLTTKPSQDGFYMPAEWAAQRLDYSQPGGEFNLARKVFAPGSFQIFRMLHGKNGYFMAFLFQKLF